jgi:hypothetical protein
MKQRRMFVRIYEVMDRERRHMLAEIVQVRGLMPLLMKPRNRQKWTTQDKNELRAHLKRLSDVSPYVAVFMLPGGFVLLPVLAWWLDRRRVRRLTTPPKRTD